MLTILLSALVVPGLICAYALILRPFLHKVPAFAKFYADADGFWAKVWAYCGNSITVLWGYILGGIGSAFALVDPLASAFGDPGLKDQITSALQANPKILGYVLTGISVVTIVARVRGLLKA